MTDTQWGAVRDLVRQAEELPPEQWRVLVECTCTDEQVAAEALRILGESESLCAGEALPETISGYRILRRIAEGGMGVIYEAEQARPRRTVALKVVRPGIMTRTMLRRFELETQALGRLQHPGIAQIYEASTSSDGTGDQPFFVMEFVRGQSLTDYARSCQLDTRARLTLMQRVCEAVQHAHEQGIVHRDLKPGNILVNAQGQPKVLDFGVARLTAGDEAGTRHTELGELVGTLAYMSPEQVTSDSAAVDTRTDVYALGVILYELLADRLPYETRTKSFHEAARAICDGEPPALGKVNRSLRGDLQTIVAKAMEKDKARRYSSAAALAEELERYLQHQPIAARPPGAIYQLSRFARRNRLLVGSSVAILLTVVTGAAVSLMQAARAREAEQIATAVNQFLQNDLLAQASPMGQVSTQDKPEANLTVRTALDRASARLGDRLTGQPLVEASIRHTMGVTYRGLGLWAQAAEQMSRAAVLRKTKLGENAPDTLASQNELAHIYLYSGKLSEAEQLARAVVSARRRLLGEEHLDTLRSLDGLGMIEQYRGRYREAERLYQQVYAARRRLLGESHPETLKSLDHLGTISVYVNQAQRAVQMQRRAVALRRASLGDDHPDTVHSLSSLGLAYQQAGNYDEAIRLLNRALEWQLRVYGDQHASTLRTRNNLGNAYFSQGEFGAAGEQYRAALAGHRAVVGNEHPDALTAQMNLANVHKNLGDIPRAEQLHRDVLSVRMRKFGEQNPQTMQSMLNLGDTYIRAGRYEEAEPLLQKVIEFRRRTRGPQNAGTLYALGVMAELYTAKGKLPEAEQVWRGVLAARLESAGKDNRAAWEVAVSLGGVLLRQRKYKEAESTLRQAFEGLEAAAPERWITPLSEYLLGLSLAGQRRFSDSEILLRDGYTRLQAQAKRIPADVWSEVHEWHERGITTNAMWRKP